VLLIATNG